MFYNTQKNIYLYWAAHRVPKDDCIQHQDLVQCQFVSFFEYLVLLPVYHQAIRHFVKLRVEYDYLHTLAVFYFV